MEEERLQAIIELVDNYTEKVQPIIERTKELKDQLKSVKPEIAEPKDRASAVIKRVRSMLEGLKRFKAQPKIEFKNFVEKVKKIKDMRKELIKLNAQRVKIKLKDMATRNLDKIKNKIKALVRKKHTATVSVKDNASAVLSKIKGLMASIAAGVVIKSTIEKGAELQTQKVAMEHFMGVGNAGKTPAQVHQMTEDYVQNLRKNANETPFETPEVIAAGTRALTISQGNTGYAMKLVKLAEDMSSADPNKTVGDAIEALADAQMGEFERMKEFGFKGSKAEFDKAGGDFFKMKDEVSGKNVNQIFGGLAKKQADTAPGMWSTIKGQISNMQQNMGSGILSGMEEPLRKVRDMFGKLGDKAGLDFGNRLGKGFGRAVDGIMSFKDSIGRAMEEIKNSLPEGMDLSQQFGDIFGNVFNGAKDVAKTCGGAIKEVLKFIASHMDDVMAVVNALGSIWNTVWPAMKKIIEAAWPVIKKILGLLLDAIGGIATAIQRVLDAWNNMVEQMKKPFEVGGISNPGFADEAVRSTVHSNPRLQNSTLINPLGLNPKSRAIGQKRVPYNNYLANLHEGERVLNRREADAYDTFARESQNPIEQSVVNKREGDIVVNISGLTVREEADVNKIVSKLNHRIKMAQLGGA